MYYIGGIAAVLAAAIVVFVFALRCGWRAPRWLLIGAIAAAPIMLLVMSVLKFASLHMYADLAHWLQLVRSIADTGHPYVLTHEFFAPGTRNYLSVHFVPLIYLFALPFKFLPYPQTLLTLNVLVMCSSAIPLYLLARRRISDQRFALLCVVLFLWFPTFQYTTLYEFEMLRFSIPIIFWMLYAWERQRIGWYYAFVILATLVREEVGLTVGMFGVYLALMERRRWHGLSTACVGFGAFWLMTGVVMPALFQLDAPFAHIAAGSFANVGTTPGAVLASLVRDPGFILALVMQPIKFANLAMLFLPLLFLPLIAPAVLLPALASFGIALLSEGATHSSYMLYYIAPSVPFFFYAFIGAWPKVVARVDKWRVWLLQYSTDGAGRAVPALMVATLMGMLVVQVFFGPSPLALQFWSDRFRPAPFRTQSFHRSVYRVTDHHRAVSEIIAFIPSTAIVSTQQFLMPRLASRRGVMRFPRLESTDGKYRAEYVLLDRTNNGLREESSAFIALATRDTLGDVSAEWEEQYAVDGYVLYRRIAVDAHGGRRSAIR